MAQLNFQLGPVGVKKIGLLELVILVEQHLVNNATFYDQKVAFDKGLLDQNHPVIRVNQKAWLRIWQRRNFGLLCTCTRGDGAPHGPVSSWRAVAKGRLWNKHELFFVSISIISIFICSSYFSQHLSYDIILHDFFHHCFCHVLTVGKACCAAAASLRSAPTRRTPAAWRRSSAPGRRPCAWNQAGRNSLIRCSFQRSQKKLLSFLKSC